MSAVITPLVLEEAVVALPPPETPWQRLRREFFAIVDAGGEGLMPLVMEASKEVKRPAPPQPLPTE